VGSHKFNTTITQFITTYRKVLQLSVTRICTCKFVSVRRLRTTTYNRSYVCIRTTGSCSFEAAATVAFYGRRCNSFVVFRVDFFEKLVARASRLRNFLGEVSSLARIARPISVLSAQFVSCLAFCQVATVLPSAYCASWFSLKWLSWNLARKFSATFPCRPVIEIQLHEKQRPFSALESGHAVTLLTVCDTHLPAARRWFIARLLSPTDILPFKDIARELTWPPS
jgi:hypothetical protein